MLNPGAGEMLNPETGDTMNPEMSEMMSDKTDSTGCQSGKTESTSTIFCIFFIILSFFRQSYLDA